MHYVTAEDIGKSYGIKPLFSNITFHINEGDKIALIARNGSGKSTLLRILAGLDQADIGKVWINKGVNTVLFEQDPQFSESSSILDNIFSHNHPIINAIKKFEAAEDANDPEKMTEALIGMEEYNAWDFDAKVKQILTKLNVHNLDQPVGSLSGGQRKRVALARTLIDIGFENGHCLLIMDEPTNHLDVEMVEWLELYVYKGDYQNYVEKKAARVESEIATIDKAKNTFRKELEWMRKQPKARTTKSKSRQDNFYEIEKVAKQKIEDRQVDLQMKMSRLGGKIAEFKKVYKKFGEKIILSGFDYTLKKGERIGIIGKNGAGKSTFVNILQGIEEPDSGKVNIGETIVFGNYSQQGLEIKKDMRVIEFVKNIAEHFPLANGDTLSASQFLELFLFSPDQQYGYISKLSGGEKRRLHLLSILFKNPNFLVLDEPTNDLDLPTLSVLENFLMDFPGCLIIISHDRYFMDRIVDHLFVFEGNGVIRDFPGNYAEYREEQSGKEIDTEKIKSQIIITKEMAVKPISEKRKPSFNEKREFEMLEKEIKELNKEKTTITLKLSDSKLEYAEIEKLSTRFKDISLIIDEKELRWLELSDLF